MDNLGTEVSNKIRSAIKAKLIELEAYVDDELPDYIMVMVANDRTKKQMEDDLGLFLNENTVTFTTWLHNVLDKLRKVTLEEVAKKDVDKKKKKKKEPKKKEKEKDKEKDKKKVKEKDKGKKDKKKSAAPEEKKNANMTELGKKKEKAKAEADLSDKEELNESYDAEAILKKAVKSSAKSLKVAPVKKGTPTKKVKKKKMINLKEDQEFYQPTKKAKPKARSRSRSYSVERRGGVVASQVQIVKKPIRRSRSRSRSPERRSVASKAILPPRPTRPTGREERGVARVLSRSILDADRSMRKKRLSPPAAYRRTRSPSHSRSPISYRDRSSRDKDRDRRSRIPHLSPEDIERYHAIKNQLKRDQFKRDDQRKRKVKEGRKRKEEDETRKLKREVDLLSSRQLAMDRELEKLGRASSLDRELKKKRKARIESIDLVEEDEDEIRIIVRRDESEEKQVILAQEEEEDVVSEKEELEIEEEEVEEEEDSEPTPPKKPKKSHEEEEKVVRRLELEDAELLEMRKKALESLMRKRKDVKPDGGKEDDDEADAGGGGGRKIIIPLNDNSSSSSDSSSDNESDVSLSDVEDLKKGGSKDKSSGSAEKEAEPMFIITLEGIDDQYFDKNKKNDGSKESAKSRSAEHKSSKKDRGSPDDGALELHPHESFDSPGQSPRREQKLKTNAKAAIAPKKVLPLKSEVKKPTTPETKSTKPKLAEAKPVKPTQAETKPTKQIQAETKATKSIQAVTKATKPIKAEAKPTKIVRASIKCPAVKAGVKTAAPSKQIATVKPSVNKPVETKIIVRTISQNPPQPNDATGEKPKPKFTPITAPKSNSPVNTVISLKPKFNPQPVSYATSLYTAAPKAAVREICKYYPNCVRGSACFYFHPSSPAEVLKFKSGNKFKWTAR